MQRPLRSPDPKLVGRKKDDPKHGGGGVISTGQGKFASGRLTKVELKRQ